MLGNQLWDKLDQFVGKKVQIEKIENVSEDHYIYRDDEWSFSWSKSRETLITYEGIAEKAEIDILTIVDCKVISPWEINDPNPQNTRLRLFIPKDGKMIFSASRCESITIVE